MRILMIAPEPFFEPRGTPFSEYHRIRALAELGHTVDLVTYPFGDDVALPGLRVVRCARPPFMKAVGIGPSWKKLPLDLALMVTACRRALAEKYDAVHSHEEGSWFGVVLAARGHDDAARAEVQEALRIWPGFAEAHNTMGNIEARA